MTTEQRTDGRAGRWGLPAAVAALFAVVLVSAALQGAPTFSPGGLGGVDQAERTPPPLPSLPPPEEGEGGDLTVLRILFQVIVTLAGAALAVFLLIVIVRLIRRLWGMRRPPRRDGTQIGAAADAEHISTGDEESVHEPAVRRGIGGALRRIDEERTPTDAIVAAWVGLEEAAADAGMVRGAAETPAEFTLRMIGLREGIADETRGLLRLYERVRFGGYEADERDRASARDDLQRIREAWR
jgi:GNAT superfamily N-acetyltransferase